MKKDQEAAIQSLSSHAANLQFKAMPCFIYRSKDLHFLTSAAFGMIISGHTYVVPRRLVTAFKAASLRLESLFQVPSS